MNVVQALSVAAAALAISGDPLGANLKQAGDGLARFAARSESLARHSFSSAPTRHLNALCAKSRRERPPAHETPDASIHAAVYAARL